MTMDNNNQSNLPNDPPKNAKERLYDRINVPLWVLDVIIWVCIGAAVFLVIYGTIRR